MMRGSRTAATPTSSARAIRKRRSSTRVERDRDGQSFTSRRVIAVQHGRPIFNMAASFQVAEAGFEHSMPMPAVAAAATLLSEAELQARNAEHTPEPYRTAWALRDRPIEFRPVEPHSPFTARPAAAGPAQLVSRGRPRHGGPR